jgi:hypothetical protein
MSSFNMVFDEIVVKYSFVRILGPRLRWRFLKRELARRIGTFSVNDQWPWRGMSARPSRRYRPAISCAPRSKSSASTAMTAAVFCAFE